KVGNAASRQMDTQPLLCHGMAIFKASPTNVLRWYPAHLCQLIGDKTGVFPRFSDMHHQMLTFTGEGKTQILFDLKVLRFGFDFGLCRRLTREVCQRSED